MTRCIAACGRYLHGWFPFCDACAAHLDGAIKQAIRHHWRTGNIPAYTTDIQEAMRAFAAPPVRSR